MSAPLRNIIPNLSHNQREIQDTTVVLYQAKGQTILFVRANRYHCRIIKVMCLLQYYLEDKV